MAPQEPPTWGRRNLRPRQLPGTQHQALHPAVPTPLLLPLGPAPLAPASERMSLGPGGSGATARDGLGSSSPAEPAPASLSARGHILHPGSASFLLHRSPSPQGPHPTFQ